MKYGYFDDAKKEYVNTTPFTPIKWANYVGTLDFGGLIDSTGGMVICKGDPALNRITKYIAQLPSSEFKGSTVYVRIKDGDKYDIFSPLYVPVLKKLDKFENHVGLLYSTFISEYKGIEVKITYFVPKGESVLIFDMSVLNKNDKDVEVDIIPVVEFSHFDALKQLINADWVPQTMTTERMDVDGEPVILQYAFMKKDVEMNFFTANGEIDSFDSDRRVFLGNNEYGSWAHPLSLDQESLNNSLCVRGDNIGALLLKLGTLKKGDSVRRVALLGQLNSRNEIAEKVQYYRKLENVDKAFKDLELFWEDYLSKFQVETPDPSMNSMLNVHNPRQCYITKNWSRYLSLYQLGYGARGIGFRDSSQDILGVMAHIPEEAKEFAKKLLSVQKRNGSAMHQFYPKTMEANEGDSREEPDRPKYYGDDHLWIIYAVTMYVKETGNKDFLFEEVPFYEKDKNGKPIEKATVWEHLVRAIEFTWNNRGQHGLPLLGFADWNDTVNLPEGAESLMIANMFGKACKDMQDLCDIIGENEYKEKLQKYYEEMKEAVDKYGWDGEWYIRYYDHKGNKIGSKENEKGKIYTNAQSWPVISGFAPKDKARKALDSLNKYLNTKFGIKLSYPGYDKYDPEIGGITTYPPGAKENGGIFLHANTWVIIAEALMRNGDRAYQYYNQINPASKNDIIDIYESEPYCYPQNVLGDEHPQFGLARNAWLSGTAAWTYVAATQYILGIRPEFDGLVVDPSLPKSWKGYSAKRQFRGAIYNITVKNESGEGYGVKKMIVDGKEIEGNKAPVFTSGEHTVEVIL